MEHLVFEPVLPLRWLAAGWALLGGLVLAYVLWRGPLAGSGKRIALALGHAAVPAFLLALLHGPTWVSVKPQDGKRPPFLALIDRSASMASDDSASGGTRHAQAVALVRRHFAGWERSFAVKVSSFDRDVRAGGLEAGATADGAMTDLARAIDEGISSGTPPAAMILLSDGIHNSAESDPGEAARRARAVGCPIYTVTLGSDAAVRDLGLQLAQAEGLTFVRQPYRALATLSHRGFENTEVKVLIRQGKSVVGETRVPVKSREDLSLNFDLVQEKPGLYEYTIEVEEHPGEVFRTNNKQRVTLRVVDERIRVLVLEGKPYWDSKFLIQALRRDANVSVSHIVQVTDSRSVFDASSKEVAPKDPRKPLEDASFLDALQVVVLGRDVEPFLSPAAVANLKEWVSRRGGHLVAARGRPVGPRASQEALLGLLPVSWSPDEERRFRLDLTERGRMLSLFGAVKKDAKREVEDDPRVLLRELPALVTASRVEQERALSVVLARGQGDGPVAEMAVLSFQPYGAGRVVVLEGQSLWRWAFQPPDAPAVTKNVFEGFWANLVRWLAGSNDFLPSQQAAVRTGKPSYVLDERPVLYVLRRPPAPGAPEPPAAVLEIRREEGDVDGAVKFPLLLAPQPVPGDAGLRRAVLDPLPEGRYRAKLQGKEEVPEAAFDVVAPLQERLDLRARPETMKRIALASDGEVIPADGVGKLQDAYFRYVARFRPDLEVRTPAWDHAGFWMLLMAWLAGLWFLRRRWGMI